MSIKNGLVPLSGLLLATALLSGCAGQQVTWGQGPSPDPTSPTLTSPSPDSGLTKKPKEEPVDLTVTAADLIPLEARCNSDEFSWNSMPSSALLYGDSVSTPFISQTMSGMMKEVYDENCRNWTFLDMNIRGYYNLPADATHTIGQINAWWMDAYLEQVDQGNTCVIKKESEGDKLFVSAACQLFAEYMNTVILRMVPTGLFDDMSLTNWHIPARSGLAVGTFPRAVLNTETEEDLRSIRLTYLIKDAQCGVYELTVAYDIYDKRLKVIRITPSDCTVTPPPGDCTKVACDTVVKTCATEYPNYPYGTFPVCKDGDGNDPSNTGHNLNGGNGQSGTQGDAQGGPSGGNPGSTYVAPTDPPAGLPVGSEPVEAPTDPLPPDEGGGLT